jgi:hypothetical protein
MATKIILGLLIAFCLVTCASTDNISDVINKPGQFENRKITVKGFLHLDSIENVVYRDKTDFENKLHKNGLVLVFNDTLAFDNNEVNHRTVEIDGVFKSTSTGNFGGQLTDVTRVEKRGK